MATVDEPRRYTFGPLERRGVVLGFQASQLAVAGTACLVAVGIMRVDPTASGLVIAAGVVVGAVGAACCSVSGRPATSWLSVVAGWVWRRVARTRTAPPPGLGHRAHADSGPAPAGPGVIAPAADRPLPGLSGLGVTVHDAAPGQPQVAVVSDRRAATYAAVVAVRARSFSLLDPDDKQQRLAAWGAALAALAREGSPVHRLQWIERVVPGDAGDLLDHLGRAGAGEGPGRRSYAELVTGAGPTIREHEVLLVLAVRARGRSRRFGSGRDSPVAVLRRELHLLEGQLDAADLSIDRAFDEADLAAALQVAVDPGAPMRRSTRRRRLAQAWPLACDEGWSSYRTDGTWHVTYWVAEWPRLDVGPDFLSPMLLSPGVRRTVAVTMAPVAPARAARQVEAARTADLADDELRRRAGFLTTARRQREADHVLRRSTELADGHAEYRFAGYVTVSAPDRAALDTACAEVEQSASQSHLELRRLYGQQEEAFTWTLPLARGLS